jgi:hypothetical protein
MIRVTRGLGWSRRTSRFATAADTDRVDDAAADQADEEGVQTASETVVDGNPAAGQPPAAGRSDEAKREPAGANRDRPTLLRPWM